MKRDLASRVVSGGLLILTLSIALPAFASELGEPGSGPSERAITHEFFRMESEINLCLSVPECAPLADDHALLISVRKSLQKEMDFGGPMFESAQLNPVIFGAPPNDRVFETTPVVGSVMYFNVDRLYTQGAGGVLKPISDGEAAGWVFQALAVHRGFHAPNAQAIAIAKRMAALIDAN